MSHDAVLSLIGLIKKAGRLEVGEEPTGAACRARKAKLVLLAGDAAPNTFRRAAHFSQLGKCLYLELPCTKGELGFCLGRSSCAMLAVTDAGFAAALAEKLQALDPERYGAAVTQLREQADRALQRQKEQRQHEKNLQRGKRKPWAAPPRDPADPGPQRPPAGRGKTPRAEPGRRRRRPPKP